jgi:hypothetical protein
MSEEAQVVDVSTHGISLDWGNVVKLLGWAFPLVLAAAVGYLHTTYATHEEVKSGDSATAQAIAPLVTEMVEIRASRQADHDLLLRIDENVKELKRRESYAR